MKYLIVGLLFTIGCASQQDKKLAFGREFCKNDEGLHWVANYAPDDKWQILCNDGVSAWIYP